MKIKTYINQYDLNVSKIKELNINKNDKIKSFLLGYGLALLIILTPFLFLINLTMYANLMNLIIFFLTMLGFIYFSISEILYHYFLTFYCPNVKEISLKINHILNSIAYFVMAMITFGIILIFMRWLI